MLSILMTTMLTGQVYYEVPQVYVCPPPVVYVAPTHYVDIYLGRMKEETRCYSLVLYGSRGYMRVPVINGYVPEVSEGRNRTVYDYRRRIPYSRCMTPKKAKERARVKLRAPQVIRKKEELELKGPIVPKREVLPRVPEPPVQAPKRVIMAEDTKRPSSVEDQKNAFGPRYNRKL
jgi:hypothetical protein